MNRFYNLFRKTPTPVFDSSFSKVCLVTGSSSGIGLETAKLMYSSGFNIVLACRDVKKANVVVKNEFEKIDFPTSASGSTMKPDITIIEMDLTDLNSVSKACNEFQNTFNRLDVLINNAGIWNGKSSEHKNGITDQGFSVTYQTSHLAHFYLSKLLMPLIINTSKLTNTPGRVVNVSSGLHTRAMNEKTKKSDTLADLDWEKRMLNEHGDDFNSQLFQYMYVKLLNVMFAKHLARIHSDKEVLSFSCHPGPIASSFYREWSGLLQFSLRFMTLPTVYGAFTSCYLATSEDATVLNNNGNYFDNCALSKHHKLVDDLEQCKLLWDKSEEQVKLFQTELSKTSNI